MLHLAIVWVGANLLGGLDLLLRSVALLGRLGLAREENQALLVGLQALDVGLEGLFGEVLAAWVNGNADGWRQLAWNTGLLQCSSVFLLQP